LRRPIVIVQVLLQAGQQGLNLVQSRCGLELARGWPRRQVSEEVLAVVLVAEFGDQMAQAAFLQLLVDVFHRRIVVG